MKYSLWLIPPSPIGHMSGTIIRQLADTYSTTGEGAPVFEPHVTIVGGIDLPNDKDPRSICQKLETTLQGKFSDGIECEIEPLLFRDGRETSKVQWSQALVAVLHKTESLVKLVHASRQALSMSPDPQFTPGLNKPHMSLFYGTTNIPDLRNVDIPTAFRATELALWKTDPATLVGVRHWEEVGRINLQ
mmetsp:Transcript_19749/g.29321  ORF Transcript_19749/g.29321 Transcript_19749/m.29321 type:complete len:189 (+) Transcript_19749:206-772(+)